MEPSAFSMAGTEYSRKTYSQSAGTWTVRAVVDGTDDYPGLEAETEFEIYKAVPAYTVPQTLSGTYGDILRDISLGTGFSWTDGSLSVGNAGEHTFEVTYTPADTADYVTVEHIPVHVMIRPKDGTGFAISPLPLQNAEDADSIVIKDGSTVLERGKDSYGNGGAAGNRRSCHNTIYRKLYGNRDAQISRSRGGSR